MRAHWMKSQKESMRLEEAGLTGDVLDAALSAFILEVVARHGEASPRLCNKDPFTLKSGTYLKHLFPKSKFLFMVRDGRATVHSIITRKVRKGLKVREPQRCLGARELAASHSVACELQRCLRAPVLPASSSVACEPQ
jgi:protein-tyrosine sulfotransferase